MARGRRRCQSATLLTQPNSISFDIKTGDVEDAPGLDSLHSYTAVLSETSPQRIIVTASKRVVESKKGRTPTRARKAATETSNIATSVSDDGKVVIIGGGSGGMGAIEGLREVRASNRDEGGQKLILRHAEWL